jgi:hypothetical protein
VSGGAAGVDHPAQGVHDVLGRDASERPGEDDEIEGVGRDLERGCRGDAKLDAVASSGGNSATPGGCVPRRVECDDGRCLGCDAARQATFAAAHLEHALSAELGESAERGDVGAFRVERARHPTIVVETRRDRNRRSG